jgi:hypothetical protein
MSLINDALKRAKHAQKENPPPPSALQFKAADPSQQRSPGPPVLLIVAVVIVLAVVGAFVMIVLQKRGASPVVNARQPDEIRLQTAAPSVVTPVANPVNAPEPVLVTSQQAVPPAGAVPVSSTNNGAAATLSGPVDSVTNSATADVDPTPSKPAFPRLQGIFYRPQRPSAVISGKNVFVGSRVGEFQVLAITQESVTISSATQTNVLSLAE